MSPAEQVPPESLGRDRDDFGRPRNSRPRDALGRPLARGATGVPRPPEGEPRTPEDAISEAQRLLDEGLPFHAHEVFEDAWKSAPPRERQLWRGLAQVAVGLTHARRGNARGAEALLRRGAENLVPYAPTAPHALEVGSLAGWADAAAHAVRDDEAIPAMPRLRRGATPG